MNSNNTIEKAVIDISIDVNEVLEDYKIANISRELSYAGRKEVLNGRAKFGIFGDGKELAQIAFAKFFKKGDWRSGYYRDQTFMLAAGMMTPEEFFYQLYGETRVEYNPSCGGRNFNNHNASRNVNEDGTWKNQLEQKNSSSDISPTGGQMPRMLGLAFASKIYREGKNLDPEHTFSNHGNEVSFGMIGDASTSEGHFFEVMNAASVLQVPLAISVWDDGYGISVPREKQTVKSSISEALQGFKRTHNKKGLEIFVGKGWDYAGLVKMYENGIELCRQKHVPVLFHIDELTQPLGHSTSGSHERYKSKERLQWEKEFDPLVKFKEWILEHEIADEKILLNIEAEAASIAKNARIKAWKNYNEPMKQEKSELINLFSSKKCQCAHDKNEKLKNIIYELEAIEHPIRKDIISTAKKVSRNICIDCNSGGDLKFGLQNWFSKHYYNIIDKYTDKLYNETETSVMAVEEVKPAFSEKSEDMHGREILLDNFDHLLSKYPKLAAFGEDLGKIGGVNQCFEGLQEKYGENRVFDTGIRETSIVGKGIGMALRGLRPIAEIQYFDYLLFALQTLSDDLATTHWRTKGGQLAPVIIRTRGHRLEGIWHSGSPLSMVINSIRGIYVCVPRNMTQAAGMYNTLLESQDPALVIEPLNGYRLKETRPDNLHETRVPFGIPEVLITGEDITIVTYGSCVRIAQEAIEQLNDAGISVELIDVQTLLPFDIHHIIAKSVKKTGRVLFFDEDVPGGATAYMMQKVLEEQRAYHYLTAQPRTLAAREHRPAYGSDGDYFSNPNAENVFEMVWDMLNNSNLTSFPGVF